MTNGTRTSSGRSWLRATLAVVVIAGAGLLVSGYFARPSIVLITIDTLRPDRLGAYGHPTIQTPALDRLAREGMLFETAYCDMPWTTGSMSSVMTGQYSSSHGVDLPTMKLKPEALTMAEMLHAEGYRTAAIVGSFPLDSVYGLDQGFETYDDEFSLPMIEVGGSELEHVPSQDPNLEPGFTLRKFQNDAYRPDQDVSKAAIQWLREGRTRNTFNNWTLRLKNLLWPRPFFLWVHYFGPHEKLRGDLGIVTQEPGIIEGYNPDVEWADRAVGRFLDELRSLFLMDRALVIVHSDHGQNLGEFGVVGHGLRIDEATVRVPMILRYPSRIPANLRRVDVAHNIDILPTVLDLVGLPAENPVGRSLLPTKDDPLGEKVPEEKQIAYFSTKLTTMILPPIKVPGFHTVLGPVMRSGLRTPEWRFVEDQVVGACTHGGKPQRSELGDWSILLGRPLPKETCEKFKVDYLYPVTSRGDAEPDVADEHPKVVKDLLELLRVHASHKAPLASSFDLSAEQEEKLRSLGYLK